MKFVMSKPFWKTLIYKIGNRKFGLLRVSEGVVVGFFELIKLHWTLVKLNFDLITNEWRRKNIY